MSDFFKNLGFLEKTINYLNKILTKLLSADPFVVGIIVVVIVAALIFARHRENLSFNFVRLFGIVLVFAGTVSTYFGFSLREYKGILHITFSEGHDYNLQSADTLFIILGISAILSGAALFFSEYEKRLSTLSKSIIGNLLLICFGISLALYPLAGYSEGILTLLCINAIAAMGLSLLTGFTGIFSLGHAAYMALGAYAAAILTVRHGVHWLPSVVAGGIIALVVAWAIGVPTLKLVGDYYTIASIGLGEAIRLILENWQSFTRGARGFPGITTFTTRYVAVAFFTVMGLLMFNLINSRHGREFKAVRDDMIAASMMGFNITQTRVFALMLSAFYCGVAGALFAGFMSFVQPSMFDMMKSTELTSVVVFGGLGSMSGTLLGTSIITLITEIFRDISQYRMFIYGLILVLVMVFRPEGLLGNREIWQFFYRRKAARK
jgi:branched-chain amino acid transport system permease protein